MSFPSDNHIIPKTKWRRKWKIQLDNAHKLRDNFPYCQSYTNCVIIIAVKNLWKQTKSGQTALEYLIVFVVLLGVLGAIRLFVSAAHSSAERTTHLVTCEYP